VYTDDSDMVAGEISIWVWSDLVPDVEGAQIYHMITSLVVYRSDVTSAILFI
jgi:hypothetical protein